MTAQQLSMFRPLPVALPPVGEDVLTPSQFNTMMAIADAIIPSIKSTEGSDPTTELQLSKDDYALTVKTFDELVKSSTGELDSFLVERPSDLEPFRDYIRRTLRDNVNDDVRKGTVFFLNALNTRVGSFLFTGSTTPIEARSVREREAIIKGWATSYLGPLQQGFRALTSLVKVAWLRTSPTLGKTAGFPRAPIHGKPGKGFDYHFLSFEAGIEPEVLETDVIVVGSSCGGAVVAKNLAEDGHRVIVVDKGYYFTPEHLPMTELNAGFNLFENGGVINTDDNSVSIIAGAGWGGGGTVNWSASLQTQGFVRKEWADSGLKFFETPEFQSSLDRVYDRMGVSTEHIKHNVPNIKLAEATRQLGWAIRDLPQNTGGNQHYCGYCTLGCGAVEKQGPIVSWLPDAVKAGAQTIEGLKVNEIIFENREGTKTAVGVRGQWTSRDGEGKLLGPDRVTREVIIKAKRVVISAGTLWSPLLLLKSGLKNPQIGRNFHCHPVSIVYGVYKEEIRPWEGSIMTKLCDEFQNLDGKGHGVKLETTVMLPGWGLGFQLWTGGVDYKKLALKLKHMVGMIVLTRDRDSGRIYPDPTSGLPRIEYVPSAYDRAHTLEGIIALAKIHLVSGAEEIHTIIPGVSPFVRGARGVNEQDLGISDPKFQEWLALVRRTGLGGPITSFGSAHQMGSCRMGVSERTSVVDPTGKVWGTEGLYVSDASVFPSASGVNPMVTNMAISDYISRHLSRNLKAEATSTIPAKL